MAGPGAVWEERQSVCLLSGKLNLLNLAGADATR